MSKVNGKSEKLISVIVPFYNEEKYISQCIDSLLAQSYINIEIICVNDGSTDNSADIVRSYQKNDNRIKLLEQSNQYAGVARNNGMKIARGEYMMFLDADDYFEHVFIEKMYSIIEEGDNDVAICNSKGFNEISKKLHSLGTAALNIQALAGAGHEFAPIEVKNTLFQLTAGWAWDKIFRSDFIKENGIEFQDTKVSNDARFVNIACTLARRIAVTEEKLVVHRSHVNTSIEFNKIECWEHMIEMLRSLKEELIKRKLYKDYAISYINFAAGIIVAYLSTAFEERRFNELYKSFREKLSVEFELRKYKEDIFLDKSIYRTLQKALYCSPIQFLCYRSEQLEDVLQMANETIYEMNETICKMNDAITHYLKYKHWYFPEERYTEGTRFALYGYGKVGRDFAWQINNSKYSELVTIIDKKWEELRDEKVRVVGLDKINQFDFDYVIVSVRNKEAAIEIIDAIKAYDIPNEKIVCPILEEDG